MSQSGVQKLNQQVDEVKGVMKDNIKRVMERGENLEHLDEKADNMRSDAVRFQKTATKLKKKKRCEGCKLWCILITIITVIFLVIAAIVVGGVLGYCLQSSLQDPRCGRHPPIVTPMST